MIPTIASGGASFKGAAAYYLHDKGASTRERVAWTETENMVTHDPNKAVKVMAWTAMHQAELKTKAGVKATGRKLEKPVFAFSLSWHPEQEPDKGEMMKAAKSAVKALGLEEHEALYVSHNDEPHKHVHVIVNRVHPRTGKAATLSKSKERLSKWAHAYEKEHGKVYCQQREEKQKTRERGSREERNRYGDPVIQKAWERSDSGRAFRAALAEEDYCLAQGYKRLVVVDKYGKTQNPVRHLDGVKAQDFNNRMKDLEPGKLPKADEIQKAIREKNQREYQKSRKYDWWKIKVSIETQNRQIEERAKLHEKHFRRIRDKRDELEAYYKTADVKAEIERLREAQKEKPSLLQRITGKAAAEREKLNALERQLENIEQRTQEKISAMEKERDQALEKQRKRHEQENENLKKLYEQRKPEFYRDEQEISQEKQQGREQDTGREREREFRPGR